jgi:hypothetical protein
MRHSTHSECGDVSIGVQAHKTSKLMARHNVPYTGIRVCLYEAEHRFSDQTCCMILR